MNIEKTLIQSLMREYRSAKGHEQDDYDRGYAFGLWRALQILGFNPDARITSREDLPVGTKLYVIGTDKNGI